MNLCKYKDVFGKPNTGVHKYKIFGFAMVDLIFTILGAFIISRFFKINVFISFIGLLILSIFVHSIFCVDTKLTKLFL
jgi:hypothetical protein